MSQPGQGAGAGRRGGVDLAIRRVLAVGIGVLFGVGVLFFGFYDKSVWGWIAIGFLALALTLLIAASRYPSGRAMAALLALGGLWLWSLLSSEWSDSPARALIGADRWALYLGVLAVLLLVVRRDDKTSVWLIWAFMVPWAVITGWLTIRLLGGHTDLFLSTRLNKPLGYVNGQADYLVLGFWPLVAVAENIRKPIYAGLAVFGATLLGCVLLLAQSRGSFLALAASAVLILAVVPGRRKRFWVLLTIVAGCAAAYTKLEPVWRDTLTAPTRIDPAKLETAVQTGLVLAVVAGVVFGAAAFLVGRVGKLGPTVQKRMGTVGTVAVIVVLVLAAAATAAASGRISHQISTQYDQFVNLKTSATGSRLTSGGGNRYDYWRIAWDEFGDHPFNGVGAGSYSFQYFTERKTTEDIRQPHSLELQTLSELGIVGGILLLLFVGAVLWGLWKRSRGAVNNSRDRRLAVAAGGTFAVWLAHTSVDWITLLPSLTGIALCCAAILLSTSRGQLRSRPVPEWARWTAVAISALVVGIAVFFIGKPVFAAHERAEARAMLVRDPAGALAKTNTALGLDDQSVENYYIRSAALARLGLYPDAVAQLNQATVIEPDNWVTWGLLGDLQVRHGDVAAARASYRHALSLNPRDPFLGPLVKDPKSALIGQ
jgi:hypothetical protein